MSSVGFFFYLLTEGFVPYVENKFIQGWDNNSFIGRHLDQNSPEIQHILNNYDGLYYQWDIGIQCKYEAGVFYHDNKVRFWTTIQTAKNVDYIRLFFEGKGPIIMSSDDIMKYWEGWPEEKFKKYATFEVFADENFKKGQNVYGVAFMNDGKMVPLNFWAGRYRNPS